MERDELERHILLSALIPVARIASHLGIPLREIKQLTELAYYREVRRRRVKMKDVSRLMSVSMSKVGLLSKQLKDHFAVADRDYELPRRVLSVLWATPLTLARLQAALPDEEPDDVEAAVNGLLADRRIEVEKGRTPRYRLTAPEHRMVREPWMARVDGLNHLMRSIAGAVEARFFREDERAFARTVSFRMRPEDADRLRAVYEKHVFPLVTRLDEATDRAADSLQMSLAFHFAPDIDPTLPTDSEPKEPS